MSACRSRITDLRGRFPSTRHKHVGSQPSYSYGRASLSMVDSMLRWLAVVFSSFVNIHLTIECNTKGGLGHVSQNIARLVSTIYLKF